MSKQTKEPKVCAARTVYRKWWDGKGKEHRITAGCQLAEGHEPPHHHVIEWEDKLTTLPPDPVDARGQKPSEDIHDRIDRLMRECSEKGWDSYDADPVQPKAAALAHIFANLLADKFVGPTVEGGLEFEWDTEDGATYMVSVHYLPNTHPAS